MNEDKKKINPDNYDPKPVEPLPFEFEIPTKLKGKKKYKKKDISLNFGNGLRLLERFINKWLGWLIGNNENPVLKLDLGKLNLFLLLLIIILILLLFMR